ncbi:unnamed protein product, partial [Linum tenue]
HDATPYNCFNQVKRAYVPTQYLNRPDRQLSRSSLQAAHNQLTYEPSNHMTVGLTLDPSRQFLFDCLFTHPHRDQGWALPDRPWTPSSEFMIHPTANQPPFATSPFPSHRSRSISLPQGLDLLHRTNPQPSDNPPPFGSRLP